MWNDLEVKEEAWEGVSAEAEREGLYLDHEVKQELLVGPEVLQPNDAAFRLGPKFEVTVVKEELSDVESADTEKYDDSKLNYSHEACQFANNDGLQLLLRPCAVRLERILLDTEEHSGKNAARLPTSSPKFKENDSQVVNSEKNNEMKTDGYADRLFICEICSISFKLRKKIISHLHSCSIKALKRKKLVQLSCKICCKRFKTKTNLHHHEQIHSGIKPFKCEICGKRYTQSSHLYRHKRTHTSQPCNRESYACDTCTKKYKTKYDLVTHMRVHSGQMPYICQCCGKKFNKKSTLVNHEITHGDKRPYSCGVCDKKFAVKWNLTKHQRGHRNETPYSCGVCGKRFMHSYSLTKHKRKHHLKTELPHGSLKKGLTVRNN